ncbi:MAG TPA: cobalamin-independent methionine synthase II family protein, partial [Chloroflexota bacterium]
MKLSTERILTTHTGSLPRPEDLVELMYAKEEGRDAPGLDQRVREAVAEIVQHQLDVGIDVIDDGEMSKPSYATYVKDRLTGFGGEQNRGSSGYLTYYRDEFPEWAQRMAEDPYRARRNTPACNGPVSLRDPDAVQRDIANLRAALQGKEPAEVFMTAVSPGTIAQFLPNEYYASQEDYLNALADVMKLEYRAIIDAGFLLQIDCPDSTGLGQRIPPGGLAEFRTSLAQRLEVLNYALEGLPPDRLRMHLCWGNWAGPHTHDVALRDILDLVFTARPSAISFEGANPRHEHEWVVFKDVKLPEGKIIIPGVIDSCSNYVEHPELVAQRILRYALLVGRENVIAGSDCGFGTFVGRITVDPRITWAKLAAL